MDEGKLTAYEEQLVDVFLLVIRRGMMVEPAIEADGRMSKSTYYELKREQGELVDRARQRAKELVDEERAEAGRALATQQAEAQIQLQQRLLEEELNNIATAVEIRDGARSDFVRLQASMFLHQCHEKANAVVLEERKALPEPTRRPSLLSLMGKKFEGGKGMFVAPDGTTLTVTGPKPDVVVEGN